MKNVTLILSVLFFSVSMSAAHAQANPYEAKYTNQDGSVSFHLPQFISADQSEKYYFSAESNNWNGVCKYLGFEHAMPRAVLIETEIAKMSYSVILNGEGKFDGYIGGRKVGWIACYNGARTASVNQNFSKRVLLDSDMVKIYDPKFLVNGELARFSNDRTYDLEKISYLSAICKSFGFETYVDQSALLEDPKEKESLIAFENEDGSVWRHSSSYRISVVGSLVCRMKPNSAEQKNKIEKKSLIEMILFASTPIAAAELKAMPNILEDSKTKDYFGYHCLKLIEDGKCNLVRSFYYSHKGNQFYLFGKELSAEFINYIEFKKGWNWSNETKKIKHDLFLSTLERFTKI